MENNKSVKIDIVFDQKGNIKDVYVLGQDKPIKVKSTTLLEKPMNGAISMAILAIMKDDDPYLVQGGKCWVWK